MQLDRRDGEKRATRTSGEEDEFWQHEEKAEAHAEWEEEKEDE